MAREPEDQNRKDDSHQQNRASEMDRAEPGHTEGDTAKDINVARGDDRPQSVRHSG